jgi:hypothetical protein
MFKDRVINAYIDLRFKRQPSYSMPELSFGFEVQSKHLELITSVIADIEDLFGRKLKILEIGAGQGFLTCSLAAMGHHVTAIEWEKENFDFMKLMQETYPELEATDIHFLEVDQLAPLSDNKYDLALVFGTLDHVYRCLNIDKQIEFSDFIRLNSRASIWEVPVFEQNAHWNWSLPKNLFGLFERFSYLKELSWLRSHSRGALRPIIFSSDELIYSSNLIKELKPENIFEKHEYVDGNTFSRKTFKVEESIIKTEIHPPNMANNSDIFLESKFLVNCSPEIASKFSFPKILGIEKGVLISQFERASITGKRLDEVLTALNAEVILGRFVSLTSELAKHGVFPNDLRPWNILWDKEKCHLIDFSSTDYFDRDVHFIPQVVSFLSTADYILSAKSGTPKWRLDDFLVEFSEQKFVHEQLRQLIYDFAWREIVSNYDFLHELPYENIELAFSMILTEVERVWSLRKNAFKS